MRGKRSITCATDISGETAAGRLIPRRPRGVHGTTHGRDRTRKLVCEHHFPSLSPDRRAALAVRASFALRALTSRREPFPAESGGQRRARVRAYYKMEVLLEGGPREPLLPSFYAPHTPPSARDDGDSNKSQGHPFGYLHRVRWISFRIRHWSHLSTCLVCLRSPSRSCNVLQGCLIMPDFVGRFGEVGSDGVAVLSSSRQSIITSLLSAGCVLQPCIYAFKLTRDTMQYVRRCDRPGLHLRPLRSPRLHPHLVRHLHCRHRHPDRDHPLDRPNHSRSLHCGSRSGSTVRYVSSPQQRHGQ